MCIRDRAGTVPVILSCILQKFFNIYGPFETLFGTIVWFNYDLNKGQLTGLFNNPNYLGMWLTLCLPFAISALKLEKTYLKKINDTLFQGHRFSSGWARDQREYFSLIISKPVDDFIKLLISLSIVNEPPGNL